MWTKDNLGPNIQRFWILKRMLRRVQLPHLLQNIFKFTINVLRCFNLSICIASYLFHVFNRDSKLAQPLLFDHILLRVKNARRTWELAIGRWAQTTLTTTEAINRSIVDTTCSLRLRAKLQNTVLFLINDGHRWLWSLEDIVCIIGINLLALLIEHVK